MEKMTGSSKLTPVLFFLLLLVLSLRLENYAFFPTALDSDTGLTYQGYQQPYTWSQRAHIWMTTPHPLGVLGQYFMIALITHLSKIDVPGAWHITIIIATTCYLLVSVFLLMLFVSDWLRRIAGLFVLLGNPVVIKMVSTLAEGIIGAVLLMISLIFILNTIRNPTSRRTIVAAISYLVVSFWHFQHFMVLALTISILIIFLCLSPNKTGSSTKLVYHLAWILGTGVIPMGLVHLFGIVRYVAYQDIFQSIFTFAKKGESPIIWIATTIDGANINIFQYSSNFIISMICAIVYGSCFLLLLWLVRKRGHPADKFMISMIIASILLPFLYEPSSAKRFVNFAVALGVNIGCLGKNQESKTFL